MKNVFLHDFTNSQFNHVVEENEFFSVEIIEEYDEYEHTFQEWQEQQRKYWALMEEGCKGNAEAAIEFCKAVAEHKVKFGPYA